MDNKEQRRANLVALQAAARITMKAIAEKIGSDPAYLSQIKNATNGRGMGDDTARRLEEAFGLGRGAMDRPLTVAEEPAPRYITTPPIVHRPAAGSPAPDIPGLYAIPLISSVQAGQWSEVIDNLAPGDAEEWIYSSIKRKRHTFALRVSGDSMTNPAGSPSFTEGMVVIVEPDMTAQPGDFVVARQHADGEATLKQLVKDGDALYLKPLNPRYPLLTLSGDAVLVGVVRSAEMRFR